MPDKRINLTWIMPITFGTSSLPQNYISQAYLALNDRADAAVSSVPDMLATQVESQPSIQG